MARNFNYDDVPAVKTQAALKGYSMDNIYIFKGIPSTHRPNVFRCLSR